MPEVLLINPRKRRATKKRRATVSKRRRNPLTLSSLSSRAKRKVRRAHTRVRSLVRRRRRNPIGGAAMGSMNALIKDVMIQSAGAVGIDVIMGQLEKYLPASLKPTSTVSGYDAVKVAATLALGMLLNKPTKGLSRKMAVGALTTQVNTMAQALIAKAAPNLNLGYAVPARVSNINTRLSGRYTRNNATLGMYNNQNNRVMLGSRNMTANESAAYSGFAIR